MRRDRGGLGFSLGLALDGLKGLDDSDGYSAPRAARASGDWRWVKKARTAGDGG